MHLLNKAIAYVSIFTALFVFVALISYHPHDQSSWYVMLDLQMPKNWLGYAGAHMSAWMFYFFGGAAYLFVPFIFMYGLRLLQNREPFLLRVRVGMVMLVLLSSLFSHIEGVEWQAYVYPGGFLGKLLADGLKLAFDTALLRLIILFGLLAVLIIMMGFTWVTPLIYVGRKIIYGMQLDRMWMMIASHIMYRHQYLCSKVRTIRSCVKKMIWRDVEFETSHEIEQLVYETIAQQQQAEEIISPVLSTDIANPENNFQELTSDVLPEHPSIPYVKPDINSFQHKRSDMGKIHRHEQQMQAQILEEKLKRFGIRGTVIQITSGPVVTLFEYQPHIDVPISKIIAREDDLALALQAMSLRIIAPIPGKSVIGFEVSNVQRKTVLFAECVTSTVFTSTDFQLPLIIGQNTIGEQALIDLVKMPHLLVAGSTGSGKSVALNSMLVSLLCHLTPDEARFILIDPKRLEFTAYTDIPHLLFPIVTDPLMAMSVLGWAIETMEERYERMAEAGVRNIYDYRAMQKDRMPYIIIVIDELADLMMVSGKEIESSIARLAQMARAAGIHLIIATQRPSVDVITGVVKVNFPARIACKVISKIDSRTILDVGGAEKLLGKGDMLFLDPQGKLIRLHGAYVADQEIAQVVRHVKSQRSVVYEKLPQVDKDCMVRGEDAVLYQELLNFVKTVDEISISLLQRRFSIGYNRSARMIEILESRGVVMPSANGKTRKVLH